MGWIALKRQKVQRGGRVVEVQPGDPIPEAEHWPNRPAWIRRGYIRETKDTPAVKAASVSVSVKPPKKVKAKKVAPVETTEPVVIEKVEEAEEKPKTKLKVKKKASTKKVKAKK